MDPERIDALFEEANQHLEAGRAEEALRCLEALDGAALDEEERTEWTALCAWALSDLGRHDEAIELLEASLDAEAPSARVLGTLGVVLSNANDLEGARDVLERALAVQPDDETAIANLALVYEKLREYERAVALYERAADFGADIDWILPRKASALIECGQYDEAKATLKRYLSLVPEDATQWVALGILHSDDDEYDEAFACYAEAEKLSPDDASLRLNWGVTAVRARRLKDAYQQLGLLRSVEPRTTRWWLLRAFILEEEGDFSNARAIYDRVVRRTGFRDRGELTYALEMAMDFFARHKLRPRCARLVERAYAANACTVELCEAYREAHGHYVKRAYWYSVVVEADYRPGLEEIHDRENGANRPPTRFARDYQVVARNHDEAIGLVLDFARKMGETNPQVREFIGQEPIEETYTGIYEVEEEAYVFAAQDEPGRE